MSKTISANLKAHQEGEVTTLATCWKLTRKDGLVYGFTSHDVDILYDDVLYEAASGLVPTDIAISSGLNVDSVDVSSFLQAAQINEVDLMAGRFDEATVDVFKINYNSTTDGVMYEAKGWILGEITVEDNQFTVELRGKAQKLQQNIIDQYGPLCRARLGDDQCQVNVEGEYTETGLITELISRQTFIDITRTEAEDVFAHGVLTLTGVSSLGSSLAIHELTNASFETGDLTGWTSESGTDQVAIANPAAYSGTYYYRGDTGDCKRSQEVDLLASGIGASQVDSELLKFSVSWFQTSKYGTDSAEIQIRFKDSGKSTISTSSAGLVATAALTWQARTYEADMPANTRYVDVVLHLEDTDTTGGTDSGIDFVHSAHTALRTGTISITYPVTLTNPSFETGDLTGWTETAGGCSVVSSIPMSTKTAYDGTYFVTGNAGVGFLLEQEVDLVSGVGLSAASIDAEVYRFRLSAYQLSSQFMAYPGKIRITFKDSSKVAISYVESDSIAPTGWYLVRAVAKIPELTRYVDIGIMTSSVACTDPCQTYFDNVEAAVEEYNEAAGYSMEVSAYDPTSKQITLYLPFPFELTPGDTYYITWGCDRTPTMCKTRYSNLINLRAEPFIPGTRALKGKSALVGGEEEAA